MEQTLAFREQGRLHGETRGVQVECQVLASEDLREDVILGYPLLVENDAVIDLKRSFLYVGTHRRYTLFLCKGPQVARPTTTPPAPDFSLEHLSASARGEIQRTLLEFTPLFSTDVVRPTVTTEHTIRLRDTTPVRRPPYRHSPQKKYLIAEEVEKMFALAAEMIRPSSSEYNSLIVIVTKRDGKPRFCVDYRGLNARTEDEVSQLTPIQENLRDLGGATVFSTLDLKSGYWQVRMVEESKHLTAFATPEGAAYEFNVMPFGLKNAPTSFQKLMAQEVLVGYLRKFVMVYLDDIMVYFQDEESHVTHLALVFERLTQHGLRVNPEKCVIATRSLDYLGHYVTEQRNRPQDGHVEAIQATGVPKTRCQLHQFLGTINWLRDYIPRCSEIVAPLTHLLSV